MKDNTSLGEFDFDLEELKRMQAMVGLAPKIDTDIESEYLDDMQSKEYEMEDRWGAGQATPGEIRRELADRRGPPETNFFGMEKDSPYALGVDDYSDEALQKWQRSEGRDMKEPFGPQTKPLPGIFEKKPSEMKPSEMKTAATKGVGTSASPKSKEDVMKDYRDKQRARMMQSEARMKDSENRYAQSQQAGSGWGGFASKAGGVLADTFSGLAGKKGDYTQKVMGQFDKTKERGTKRYASDVAREKGYMDDYDKSVTRGTAATKAAQEAEAGDPNSKESEAARIFYKEMYPKAKVDGLTAKQVATQMKVLDERNKTDFLKGKDSRDYKQKERQIQATEQARIDKPTKFEEKTQQKQAERFAATQEAIPNIAKNMDKVDNAIDAQLKYSKESMLGTGPIATLGGMTKYASQDSQNLEAKFREINLKNMVSTFSGMSKAVDSDAERRAWESTQASLSNDDEVNLKILYGAKSTLLKDKAVAEAQNAYVQQNGNLNGFEQSNPILRGDVTTLVAPNGEMQLVPKTQAAKMEQQGFKKLDDYVDAMVKNDFTRPTTQARPTQTKSDAEKWLMKNPNDPRAEAIRKKLGL